MTTEEIKQRVEKIQRAATGVDNFNMPDNEAAHIGEDKLHLDFIKYVVTLSDSLPNLAEKARLVASTEDIKFYRWHA